MMGEAGHVARMREKKIGFGGKTGRNETRNKYS
jgi:hypothetical protein